MADELQSIADVIRELGGASAVAKLTNRSQPAVSNWVKRGYLPSATFLVLTNALQQRNKTASPSLWTSMEQLPSADQVSQDVKSTQVA